VGVDVECALKSEDADGWGSGIHSLILVHCAARGWRHRCTAQAIMLR
jgi:hypothetical protein